MSTQDGFMGNGTPYEDSTASIEVLGVSKRFPVGTSGESTVLRDVTVTIPKGSFTILFGPSGSGKTTLINTIAGLAAPTAGTVYVNNQNIYALTAEQRTRFRAQHMGIFHQTNYWIRSLNVLENVAMPLYLSGSTKAQAIKAAKKSLQRVGMAAFADSSPLHLSGGQQQLVSLARALVGDTDIILADEPTGNLDSESGKRVMGLLANAYADLGCTVVLITHNLEYLQYGTQRLFINDGVVTELQRGEQLPTTVIQSLQVQMAALQALGRGQHGIIE